MIAACKRSNAPAGFGRDSQPTGALLTAAKTFEAFAQSFSLLVGPFSRSAFVDRYHHKRGPRVRQGCNTQKSWLFKRNIGIEREHPPLANLTARKTIASPCSAFPAFS